MPAEDMTFIHMSDLHVEGEGVHYLGRFDGYAASMRVLDHIVQYGVQPAFVVITGDLIQGRASDDEASYANLKRVVASYKETLNVPVLLTLGNGDMKGPFRRVILGETNPNHTDRYYYSQTINGLRMIVLDSHSPLLHAGQIDQAQLDWLKSELESDPDTDTVITVHHSPARIVIGADAVELRNAAELGEVIRGHSNILGLLTGHIHASFMSHFEGFLTITATGVISTGFWSYGRKERQEVLAPGYNLVHVRNSKLLVQFIDLPGERPTMHWTGGFTPIA